MASLDYWKISAQADYDRAMAKTGAERAQRLAKITMDYPEFALAWSALAECHLRAQRSEEARGSARRAVALDPDLYTRLSAELKVHCRDLLPVPASAEPPGARLMRRTAAPPPAQPAPSAKGAKDAQSAVPAGPGYDVRQAGIELNRARALQGFERIERIEALSREYPEHGPIWLALATHSMAARRLEEAVAAMDRAIALDPELGRWFTPEMATEYRYRGRYRDRLAGIPLGTSPQPEPPRPVHAPDPRVAAAARPQTVQAGGATRMTPVAYRPAPAAGYPAPQPGATAYPAPAPAQAYAPPVQSHAYAPQYAQGGPSPHQTPQAAYGHFMQAPVQKAAPNAPTMLIGVPVPAPAAPVYVPPPVQPVQPAVPIQHGLQFMPQQAIQPAASRGIPWRLVGALAVGIGAGVAAAMLAVVLSDSSGEVRADKAPAATESRVSPGDLGTREDDVLFSADDLRMGK